MSFCPGWSLRRKPTVPAAAVISKRTFSPFTNSGRRSDAVRRAGQRSGERITEGLLSGSASAHIAGSRAVATRPYSTGVAARSDYERPSPGSRERSARRRLSPGPDRAPDRCGTALAGSSNLRIDRCGTSGTSAVSTSRYRAAGGRTAAAFLDSGAPAPAMRATRRLQPRRSTAPLPFFARTREEEEWTMPSSNG